MTHGLFSVISSDVLSSVWISGHSNPLIYLSWLQFGVWRFNVPDTQTQRSTTSLILNVVHQDFHLNRVMMEEGAGAEASAAGARPKKKSRKTYDLTAADKFWQKHKGRWVCISLLNGQIRSSS